MNGRMNEKRFELRLCPNGNYYLYKNNQLTEIDFDKFNKESAESIVNLLNEQDNEIKQLKKELRLMKGIAYHYGSIAIIEIYDKDRDELRQEIYGEEAEEIKQKEIKEEQESLQRLKEQGLVKVNCYVCKHGLWLGGEEGLTCEKRIKPFPNECEYFIRH